MDVGTFAGRLLSAVSASGVFERVELRSQGPVAEGRAHVGEGLFLRSALEMLKGVSEGRMVRFPLQRYEPLKAELEAFAQPVIDDAPVPVSGQDGLQALRLALALVESGQTHRVVEIG